MSLAEQNGRTAFESGRPLDASNPYRRGTANFQRFVDGYENARRGG